MDTGKDYWLLLALAYLINLTCSAHLRPVTQQTYSWNVSLYLENKWKTCAGYKFCCFHLNLGLRVALWEFIIKAHLLLGVLTYQKYEI